MITQERLKELLTYDPATGEFRWIVSRGPNRAGNSAGCIDKAGYRIIEIDGKAYRAARLAFLYMTGAFPNRQADHRDTNPGNDRWENLRDATHSQNCANKRARGKLGVKGVSLLPSGNYRVIVKKDGRRIHLGVTDNFTIAGYMYRLGAAFYHGEFARVA